MNSIEMIFVDTAGQFASPYVYVGNGVNPVNGVDADGNILIMDENTSRNYMTWLNSSSPEVNAIRWKRFNTLNNSPRVYQSVYREEIDFDFTIGGVHSKGEYNPQTNIGYINGTMENFFHEILGHAYQDELFMLEKQRDLGQGFESKDEYIILEIDAHEIESGRTLDDSEQQQIEKVYGDLYDRAE